MSDDTPTVQFPNSQPASTQVPGSTVPPFQRPPTRQRPQRPSRGPRALFVVLAILVVAAIVVLVVILDTRLSTQSQPAPTDSPSATPAVTAPPATHTSTPPPTTPPASAGTFTTFVVPQAQGGCGHQDAPTVMVTWATANTKSVWIQQGTVDAAAGGGTELPLSGNQSNVPETFTVNCDARFNTYSITLVGDDGAHVSKTWTIRVGGRGHHF